MIRQSTQDTPITTHRISPQRCRLNQYYQAILKKLHQTCGLEASQPLSLGVTSSRSGEGVSSIAAELAISAAQIGPTLLIESNIMLPSVNKIFDISQGPGLLNVVIQGLHVCECVQKPEVENLSVLTSGTSGTARDLMNHSGRLSEVFDSVRHNYRFLICDLPSVEEESCTRLAQLLDGVVLVVEAERVSGQTIRQAKEKLELADVNLLGAVFNKQPDYIPSWLQKIL